MVVHILGKSIRAQYRVSYGLANTFYGIGQKKAEEICAKLGFYPDMRIHQLTEPQTMAITKELSQMEIEGSLLATVRSNIMMKVTTGSYAGSRHANHLPVHGQRTKSNARTARLLNRPNRRA